MTSTDSTERAYRVRERILKMAATPQGAHVGGCLSVADLLTVLYGEVLRVSPDEPDRGDRDWFVLSKGHAGAALYAVLAEFGFIPADECDSYAVSGGRLAGHPLRRLPGVEFPTGSLGHGLSLGCGAAVAARAAGTGARAFVLLGDGELQEGSVWEAVMLAGHQGLDNLVAVVDRNGLQITGDTEECVSLEPLADRWRSFGWAVAEVDGHDHDQLRKVFAGLPVTAGRPTVVLARTVKGRGVGLFEGKKKSHHVTLSPRLFQRAVAGLRKSRADAPPAPNPTGEPR
ncbi:MULTISPECIES: transketolase [Micromonospora]|uniref:Transketolase subunit A n=1 Tax=Micromonospora yangpuensis TaxID=683228 RepID=A0A1C6VGX6_9ACTN|nr:transketolase [Micromonospora yangpuensis]GGL99377.1 transketolase, N-terminal subunit [Micromonospora yangpuensis]SCL65589.1 transketolase subunit A [Micromonospora yangpuensis]